jgi:hypothetical protein
VVARLRSGPLAAIEPGTKQIPISPSSWTQGPNEFQELHIGIRASSILCELRVTVLLDGKRLQTWFLTPSDLGQASWTEPIFEPGAPTTYTLTAEATPTSFCGETNRGGTLEYVKADVIGFS